MRSKPWNEYIGAVWAGLLRTHRLDPAVSVIEIGPGFTVKLGLALAALDFAGMLYVVEPDDAARSWVVARYVSLLPGADIVGVGAPIADAAESLPESCDALLMNHVLDDLVLRSALRASARDSVFGSIRPGGACHPEVAETWRRLAHDRADMEAHCARALNELEALVAATAPRILGASQYSTWFHAQNELAVADRIGAEMLESLSRSHGATLSADRRALTAHDQDPARWLLVDRLANGSADRAA